jgi:hypothetical protein
MLRQVLFEFEETQVLEKLSISDYVLGYEHDIVAETAVCYSGRGPKLCIEQQPRWRRTEELLADGRILQQAVQRRHYLLPR